MKKQTRKRTKKYIGQLEIDQAWIQRAIEEMARLKNAMAKAEKLLAKPESYCQNCWNGDAVGEAKKVIADALKGP